jgi:hypothetical protein
VNHAPATLAAALAVALGGAGPAAGAPTIPAETRQLMLVLTEGWDAPSGTLSRWEREPGKPWRQIGEPIVVVVGSAGLGWGRGLHAAGGDGPVKREGDRRGPAGVFRLGEAFGYAARADEGVHWPYRPLVESSMCVDDPGSPDYNKLVEAPADGPRPWKSAERMRFAGRAYRRGVVVEHNTRPPQPGAGSCMFLHVWPRPHRPTSGCTAMDAAELSALLRWLRPDAHPVLVQAPSPVYALEGARWGGPTVAVPP